MKARKISISDVRGRVTVLVFGVVVVGPIIAVVISILLGFENKIK